MLLRGHCFYGHPLINLKSNRKGIVFFPNRILCLFEPVELVRFLCVWGIKGLCINWCQNEIWEITCVLVNAVLCKLSVRNASQRRRRLMSARSISWVNRPYFLLIFKYLESRNFTSVINHLDRMHLAALQGFYAEWNREIGAIRKSNMKKWGVFAGWPLGGAEQVCARRHLFGPSLLSVQA